MRQLFWRLALPSAAAVAFLAVNPAARADTVVSYTTSFTFGTSPTDTAGDTSVISNNGSSTASLAIGGETLTFAGANKTNLSLTSPFPLGLPEATDFGGFSLSGSGPVIGLNDSFTLTVSQTVPSLGTGSFGSGTITGNIVTNNGVLELVFTSPTTLTLGTASGGQVVYSLNNFLDDAITIPPGTGTTFITGTVAAAPLPATASTGLALLGGLGLLSGVSVLRRRRQMA